jgi:hypothetical protein
LAECGGTLADINGNIKDFTGNYPHQLALGLLYLVVQTPQDVSGRARMVVLDKTDVQAGQFLPGTLVETLEKKATFIAEYPRFEYQDIGDGG